MIATRRKLALRIVETLRLTRFRAVREKDLQEAVAEVLRRKRIRFEREVRLGPRDIIDFKVGKVGVEVKTKGSSTAVLRQVMRYLAYPSVAELIIVSSRARSTLGFPMEIMGKPVSVVHLWRGFL